MKSLKLLQKIFLGRQHVLVDQCRSFCQKDYLTMIAQLEGTHSLITKNLMVAKTYASPVTYPQIICKEEVQQQEAEKVRIINDHIVEQAKIKQFKEFAPKALQTFSTLFHQQVDELKLLSTAVVLQLSAPDPFHISIVADRDLSLRQIFAVLKILDPNCADVLQILKAGDLFQLEQTTIGFIADADNIEKIESIEQIMREGLLNENEMIKKINCSFLLALNPVGQYFVARSTDVFQKQVPNHMCFKTSHLIFFVQKSRTNTSQRVVAQLTKADVEFLQSYIAHVQTTTVHFPHDLTSLVALHASMPKFNALLQKEQLIKGIIRASMALARLELQTTVTHSHVERIIELYTKTAKFSGLREA